MTVAVTVVFVITTVLLIVGVLAQRGSGTGLSSFFGGGVAAGAGASASTHRNLVKFTAVTAVVWVVSVIALGLLV